MARFDVHREPAPKLQAKALKLFSDDHVRRPQVRAFAYLVAQGEGLADAYLAVISATASPATAKSQSSVLAAHPKVRGYIVAAGLPATKLTRALVPAAIEVLADGLDDENPNVRQKAADSVLDRGGVPRKSETHTSIQQDIQISGAALLELAAALPFSGPVTPAQKLHANNIDGERPRHSVPDAVARLSEQGSDDESDPARG